MPNARTKQRFDTDNFIVTNLPDYVQGNHDILIREIVLSGGTIQRMTLQTGVKKSAYLNYLDIDPEIQDGTGCGFTPQGDVELNQRTIETALLKVDMDICPENLRGKYAEYLLKTAATSEDLPFEQYIMDGVRKSIAKQMETAVWKWQKSDGGDDLFDGLLYIAGDESDVIDVSIAAGSSAYAGILAVYMALPEEVIERGAEIYVSPAIYRQFLQEMVALNYYHYSGPQESYPEEFTLIGTNAKVVKTSGLSGSLQILGTFPRNLVYGTDLESDREEIDLWFSKDDRVWKLQVKWVAGVQIAYPDMVVLGTFAAAPSAGIGINDALNRIADNTAAIAENTEGVGDGVAELADADHVFKAEVESIPEGVTIDLSDVDFSSGPVDVSNKIPEGYNPSINDKILAENSTFLFDGAWMSVTNGIEIKQANFGASVGVESAFLITLDRDATGNWTATKTEI